MKTSQRIRTKKILSKVYSPEWDKTGMRMMTHDFTPNVQFLMADRWDYVDIPRQVASSFIRQWRAHGKVKRRIL